MKQITLIGGKRQYISDEEAENIKKIASRGGFVELRDGTFINTSSVSVIGDVEKMMFWKGWPITKSDNNSYSFMRDGERIFLEAEHIKQINYELPDELRNNPDVLRVMEREEPVLPEGMPVRGQLQRGEE